MLEQLLAWIAVAGILAGSAGLVLQRDWRWGLSFLALQYLGAFALISIHWPAGLAAAKLVTGWMATAILGITRLSLPPGQPGSEAFWPRSRWFHGFLVAIGVTLAAGATSEIEALLPGLGLPVVLGSTLLVLMGLLQLSVTADYLRVIIGLLTFLTGFEVLYSAVEGSVLVGALLSIVNLGLALAGAYLLVAEAEAQEA